MSYEQSKKLFTYENGNLYWIKKNGTKGIKAGRFSQTSGYSDVRYQGKSYKVHNLVWIWHGNSLVDGYEIDHIDNNRNNNCIENLQLLTPLENVRKQERVRNPKGCYFYMKCRNRWKVKLARKQIGYFKTEKEAIEALEFARLQFLKHINQLD
jgi:hypothetical protein